MKYARYLAHGQISYGVVEGDSVKELSASPFENFQVTDHSHKLSEVKLLAPCVPPKILANAKGINKILGDRFCFKDVLIATGNIRARAPTLFIIAEQIATTPLKVVI